TDGDRDVDEGAGPMVLTHIGSADFPHRSPWQSSARSIGRTSSGGTCSKAMEDFGMNPSNRSTIMRQSGNNSSIPRLIMTSPPARSTWDSSRGGAASTRDGPLHSFRE